MFTHGVIGLCIAMGAVLIEAAVSTNDEDDGIRLFHYTGSIYLFMVGASLFDTMAVNSVVIAFQSDSSGFVSLISYINIIYAFAADLIIFNESFSTIELVAALVILVVTVSTSIYKISEAKKNKLLK